MAGKEIEVKFLVANHEAVRERVIAVGGLQHSPRALEVNLRFDDAANSLTPAGVVLRLRRDESAWITFKRPLASEGDVKVRMEHEVELGDFEAARAILEGLGYHVGWRYEKYREVFHLGAAKVMLDELPFGSFVEVEAPDEAGVRETAILLGFAWEKRYLGSYANLFSAARRSLGFTFSDLTFANFAGVAVKPSDLGL